MKILKKTFPVVLIVVILMSVLSPALVYAQDANEPPVGDGDEVSCGITNFLTVDCLHKIGREIMSGVGSVMIAIFAWVLWVAGLFLNFVIDHTIIRAGVTIPGAAIDTAWGAMRDLANLFFIFVLLYIAIGTILGLDSVNTKKMLVHVIIIALLLNFSLFFTKVIIDASNATSAFFVGAMPAGVGSDVNIGLSGAFMRPLGLSSYADVSGAKEILQDVPMARNILLLAILSSALFLIVAVVFMATGVMLIARFLIFIFLMILSPLAFVAMALPKDEYSQKWWKALFNQAIWAPALFALLWVSLVVLSGILSTPDAGITGFTKMIAGGENNQPEAGSLKLLLNFSIIIGLAILSLIVAKQIGAVGGGRVIKFAQGAGRYVGRGVAGATARTALRGFGLETAGSALQKWGQRRGESKRTWVKGLGKVAQGVGIAGQATSARKLYEKASQTRLLQRGPQGAIMEGTLGALVKGKVYGKSAQEAYKEDEELTSKRRTIRDVKRARKEKKKAIKDREAGKITDKRLKEINEDFDKKERHLKKELYTKEAQEADDEKEKEKKKMKEKEEKLRKVLERLAGAVEKDAEEREGDEDDDKPGNGSGAPGRGPTPTPSESPKPHTVEKPEDGEGPYSVEPPTTPPTSPTPPPSSPPSDSSGSSTPPSPPSSNS